MRPYLIPKNFDLSYLLGSEGKILFTSDRLALCVQSTNPHIPENTGLGVLSEAINCKVKHGPKGYDELEMEYPINGHLYPYITNRALIVANVERTRGNQAYRIYKIKKTIKGRVQINARHIAYDLGGIITCPFKANNLTDALTFLKTRSLNMCPFNFSSTRNLNIPFEVKHPTAIWDLMGSNDDCLQSVYNGEYLFDNYDITFEERLGTDNNVQITYGVNMTDFEQDASCENCFTGAIGYWVGGEEDNTKVVYSSIVHAPGRFNYERLTTIDLSSYWDEAPTKEELNETVATYVKANNIGVPEISWKINFVPLDTTEEYKNIAQIQYVSLGDIVHVHFEKLGIDASARVVEIEWDVLNDKYSSVSLGDVKKNVASTLASYGSAISQTASRSDVIKAEQSAVDKAEKASTQALDTFIQAGTLSASQIQGGELIIGGQDNQNGIIKIVSGSGTVGGTIKNTGLIYDLSVTPCYISAGDTGYLIMLTRSEEDGGNTSLGGLSVTQYLDAGNNQFTNSGITLYEYDHTNNTKRRTAYLSGRGRLYLYDDNGDETVRIDGRTGKIECLALEINGHNIT